MTFAICLFIILMQFVWKYVEDLVGKGLETSVLAELFTYAALTLVPMALPLAILLASLMAFGNLGERYELLAIKAAGISLLRAMKPLVVLVILISIGAFIFQNNVIPIVQVKFKALMISIRQKSPELDIPENTFYSGINNYNLYIKSKNLETGMLYDVMIYDTSKGFDNMAVIVCDSGKLKMSVNKDFLLLTLYDGQDFRNFQQSSLVEKRKSNNGFVPYGRQNFHKRQVIIPFNANFTRMDEASMDNTQISKDIFQLRRSIDSLSYVVDSLNINDRKAMLNHTYLLYRMQTNVNDTLALDNQPLAYDLDSVLNSLSHQEKVNVYNDALMRAESNKNDFMFRSMSKTEINRSMRRHDVELQRKFVLSFACIIFFFIGAPLGAIIRKGGLGMPVVISVGLFIVYYIIDNVGYKMARDGVWEVWQGVWLSSFILFPLGVFITYKAINDSALFNPEAYEKYLRKILFIKNPPKVDELKRNIILNKISNSQNPSINANSLIGLELMESDQLRDIVYNNKTGSCDKKVRLASLKILKDRGADINDIIDQQDTSIKESNLVSYSNSAILVSFAFILAMSFFFIDLEPVSSLMNIAYSILYLRSLVYYFDFYDKRDDKSKIYHTVICFLLLILYPFMYIFVRKKMERYLQRIQII
jgi:lipopolysaccharide export system permease protein